MPAGRNRSTLCTGMMKQSRSRVASEMGSALVTPELAPPPKFTVRYSEKPLTGLLQNDIVSKLDIEL